MANPTTNYGFVLPTATDLVTDLPADFDVALQGVDTRLKALQPGTTLGDIVYSSATANTNTRLGIGSSGNVLTVSGGVPVWSAPLGGGKVLQVIQATSTTSTATTSTSYTDSTLTATITPSSATSKVLVMTSQSFILSRGGVSDASCRINLMRGATEVFARLAPTLEYNDESLMTTSNTIIYLDSPATTSATTYKTQQKSGSTSHTITTQPSSQVSVIILMEIGA
jgi:hypothetical protein